MSQKVKFSIIVPVYNRARSISPTLDSVRSQTFPDWECIIVDDGSQDSAELLSAIRNLDDERFIYIRQENQGGGAARNAGIFSASGEWIAFLDSDDRFMSSKLEVISSHILERPSVDVWSHIALVERGDGLEILRPRRLPDAGETVADMMFKRREFLQTSTLVVRTSRATKVAFDPSLKKAQDVDFLVRLEQQSARVVCIDQVLSVWNDRPGEGRIGAPRRPESVLDWYSRVGIMLPKSTKAAFEATYLSYEIARVAPLRAFWLIMRAFFAGATGVEITLRSLARAYLAGNTYRKLVDRVMPKYKRQKEHL